MELSLETGQVLDGKYRIERPLGKGSMGSVFQCTHLGTKRTVAVKLVAPQFSAQEQFVERFKREAEAAGRLRHPNVVDVTDFGFAQAGSGRIAYLVMEYLDGCTLSDVLAEETSLPLDWVVDILDQVCSAVEEAHQQGVIHRDLKPDNIWLEPNRRGGYTVKVLDFGLAKLSEKTFTSYGSNQPLKSSPIPVEASSIAATQFISGSMETNETARSSAPSENEEARTIIIDAEASPSDEGATQLMAGTTTPMEGGLTMVGSLVGTPLYMSPEQCRGEALDARSDVYSIGVIAYQMLTGHTPFTGSLETVVRAHQEVLPLPLKRRDIPKRVARLVLSALAKNPADRPQSALSFSGSLRAHTEGVGVLLRRASAIYSEHFPLFIKISFLAHIPVIVTTLLLIGIFAIDKRWHPPTPLIIGLVLLFGLPYVVASILASGLTAGLTVPIVTQIYLAPLRPIRLRTAYHVFRKRMRGFATTTLLMVGLTMLGLIFCLIPGLIVAIRYAMYAPVSLLENLKNRAALSRANSLRKQSPTTVFIVVLLGIAIPFVASIIFQGIPMEIHGGVKPTPGGGFGWSQLVGILVNTFVLPLVSIMTVLLYFKTRQAAGEYLRDALDQIDDEEMPRSVWQRRMRESLKAKTHISYVNTPTLTLQPQDSIKQTVPNQDI